jgi:uncharacterized membrane protein YjjB (DUF3815 family)
LRTLLRDRARLQHTLQAIALNHVESASLVAALAVGAAVQRVASRFPVSRNALHVVGCVPMIPGAFAAKAILGLFAISAQHSATNETFIAALDNALRVALAMGALGAGGCYSKPSPACPE